MTPHTFMTSTHPSLLLSLTASTTMTVFSFSLSLFSPQVPGLALYVGGQGAAGGGVSGVKVDFGVEG